MKAAKYIIVSIILIVIGFLIHKHFWIFSFSQMNNEGITLESRTISGRFYLDLLFSITLGILPILYYVLKRITKINFVAKGLFALVLIIGFGILSWQFRIYQLNQEFQYLLGFQLPNEMKISFKIQKMYLELYLLIGFILGTIISIVIFKNKIKAISH